MNTRSTPLGALPAHDPPAVLRRAKDEGDVVVAGEDGVTASCLWQFGLGHGIVVTQTDLEGPREVARRAVDVALGSGALLAKGSIPTSVLLRAILERPGRKSLGRLVHVSYIYLRPLRRAFLLADAGVNVQPNAEARESIAMRAVDVARALGMEPCIAVIGHADEASSEVESSMRGAAWVEELHTQGTKWGAGASGPISLDLALSERARNTKGHGDSPTSNILLAPDIVIANVIYKSFMLSGQATIAGVVVGDGLVCAVPSRVASATDRAMSVALARVVSRGFVIK